MQIALYEALQALFASWNVVLPSKRYADSQAGNTDSWAQEVVDWMQEKCEDIIAIVKLPVATVQGAFGWFFNESDGNYYVTDAKGRQYRLTQAEKEFIEGRYKTITNDGELENVSVQSLVSNMTNSVTSTANPSQFGLQVSKELNALTRGIVAIENTQSITDWFEKILRIPSGNVSLDISEFNRLWEIGNSVNGFTTALPITTIQNYSNAIRNAAEILGVPQTEMIPIAQVVYKKNGREANSTHTNSMSRNDIRYFFTTLEYKDRADELFFTKDGVVYSKSYNSKPFPVSSIVAYPYESSAWSDASYLYNYEYEVAYYSTGGDIDFTMTTYDYSTVDIIKRSQIDSKEAQDYSTTGVIPDIVNTDDKERNLVIDPSIVDSGTWEQGAEKDATAETGANTIDKDAAQTQTVTLAESITNAITDAIESIFENIGLFPDVNVNPEVPEGERAVQGLFTIWNPTEKQVAKLASYLWSSAFDDIIAQFKKWFSNPLDAIITLAYYPITPESTTTGEIKLGWFASGVTGVKKITTAKGELNCGKITIPKKYNNFLDFSPYTKVSLYLPFVGVVPLQADDVIGGSIEVIYRWEYLTGSCVAYVNVYNVLLNGKTMYQYSGNISMQIPLTGANYSNVYSGLVGGLGTAKAVLSKGGGIAGAVAGFAGSALNVKEDIQRTGSMSGNAGMLGNLTPYVIIERPLPDSPTTYNKLLGRESNSSVKIKDIKGYTECASVDLKNVRATAEEKEEIEKILLSGFYA